MQRVYNLNRIHSSNAMMPTQHTAYIYKNTWSIGSSVKLVNTVAASDKISAKIKI